MKTIFPSKLLLVFGLLGCVSLFSCKSYEEVSPRVKEDVSKRVYRVADPKPLTPDEEATLKATQDEYKKNGNK